MAATVFGLLLSFVLAWAGRDPRYWTPKFKGTDHARFVQAIKHYEGKMGLRPLAHEVSTANFGICASVQRDAYGTVTATWYPNGPRSCKRVRPEVWALHEACHVRYAHHEPGVSSPERWEAEARACMVAYSQKERR